MPLYYHRTSKVNVESILEKGLLRGSVVCKGEGLPFVMATSKKYKPQAGGAAYFELELDANDPQIVRVNDEWIEYYGDIPRQQLIALSNPPVDNDAVVKSMRELSSKDFRAQWGYKSI